MSWFILELIYLPHCTQRRCWGQDWHPSPAPPQSPSWPSDQRMAGVPPWTIVSWNLACICKNTAYRFSGTILKQNADIARFAISLRQSDTCPETCQTPPWQCQRSCPPRHTVSNNNKHWRHVSAIHRFQASGVRNSAQSDGPVTN